MKPLKTKNKVYPLSFGDNAPVRRKLFQRICLANGGQICEIESDQESRDFFAIQAIHRSVDATQPFWSNDQFFSTKKKKSVL